MISLGIIGEYIAKIYDEIKARPVYLVENSVGLGESVCGETVATIGTAQTAFTSKSERLASN
jgi:hypothetical protein